MICLIVSCNCMILFVLYQLILKGLMGELFPFFLIALLSMIFTFVTGIGILYNLLETEKTKNDGS